MRNRVIAAVALAAVAGLTAAGQAARLVTLRDPRFGLSVLGPEGWTLSASSASTAVIRSAAAGESIEISAVPSPATPQSALGSPLAQTSGAWTCLENAGGGRCARTISGGVLVVLLNAPNALAYRTLGGLTLVRNVAESASGFRPVAAAQATTPALTSSTGIPACDDYVAMVERYAQCPQVPLQAKEAVQQAMDQMRAGLQRLNDPGIPPDARKAAADSCKQAVDALRQGAAVMGCSL